MKTFADFQTIVEGISYPGMRFVVSVEPGKVSRYHLRVEFDALDNVTGEPASWNGRWWRLSTHMTDGEVVQTAFKAVLTAIEHEAREQFKFMGTPVFDPHYDIYKLVALRRQADALQERPVGKDPVLATGYQGVSPDDGNMARDWPEDYRNNGC